jgi:hypothetical protein
MARRSKSALSSGASSAVKPATRKENPYLGLPAKDAAEQAVIDACAAAWWRG